MNELIIKSKFKDYKVYFETNSCFFDKLINTPNSQFVIDEKVYELYKDLFVNIPKERLFLIVASENNKVIETALDICEKITEISAKRNTTLISIGGGIIQDITGFVANITYRGINWIFVPTTLLAACDSCIGGKTSLNYKKYKNLLGTFFPPDEIHIYPEMFKTLSEKDYKSGLGEVFKFNLMSGKLGISRINENSQLLIERNVNVVNEYVLSSLLFKKKFIEVDEFDKGERIKLNFAHTFGHAIETITAYEIPHGTAVAIGMIMANHVSYQRGLISKKDFESINKLLLKIIDIDIKLLKTDTANYINAMRKDKKQISSDLTAVLISKYLDESELTIVHDLKVEEADSAIKYFINLYEE